MEGKDSNLLLNSLPSCYDQYFSHLVRDELWERLGGEGGEVSRGGSTHSSGLQSLQGALAHDDVVSLPFRFKFGSIPNATISSPFWHHLSQRNQSLRKELMEHTLNPVGRLGS